MDRMFAKWGGSEVLRKAVSGMLPKNRLRDKRLARLKGECRRVRQTTALADKADWSWIQLSRDWPILTRRIS